MFQFQQQLTNKTVRPATTYYNYGISFTNTSSDKFQKMGQKLQKTAFLMLFLVGFLTNLQAQEVIDLWKTEIPGSKTASDYSEEQQREGDLLVGVSRVTRPQLTVFKAADPSGAAVIICPGGGYAFLAIDKEGFKVAQWFNERGITAFVLKYRLPSDQIMDDKSIGPLQDAQRAMRLVRENAKTYGIDTSKVGIMGFSAGGHLASTLSTHYKDKVYEQDGNWSARPDFSVLAYPVISMQDGVTHQGSRENLLGATPAFEAVDRFSNEKQITPQTPPTFLVHAADDNVVPVANSIEYFSALNKNGVPAELHVYEKGGHGFGLGTEPTSNDWPVALASWLKTYGWVED